MGVDVHGLRFLEYAFRAHGAMGSTLTIGRQGLHVSKRELARHLGIPAASACLASPYADDLLMEHFGASAVASVDASDYEGCKYKRDLNLPLEPDFPKFDTIVDAGSLEHVLDVSSSFENMRRCCKVGGQILHVTPTNNFIGHGFYQFSPELFYGIYNQVRGFEQTEVFLVDHARPDVWWKVVPPRGNWRSTAMSRNETYALVRTKKLSEEVATSEIQQPLYEALWETGIGEGEHDPTLGSRGRLRILAKSLPTNIGARLVQMKNKAYLGMNSRNPALSRVDAPSRRLDLAGQYQFGR